VFGASVRVVMQSDISAVPEHFSSQCHLCNILEGLSFWRSDTVLKKMPTVDQMIGVVSFIF
jgi:hypothetical protein